MKGMKPRPRREIVYTSCRSSIGGTHSGAFPGSGRGWVALAVLQLELGRQVAGVLKNSDSGHWADAQINASAADIYLPSASISPAFETGSHYLVPISDDPLCQSWASALLNSAARDRRSAPSSNSPAHLWKKRNTFVQRNLRLYEPWRPQRNFSMGSQSPQQKGRSALSYKLSTTLRYGLRCNYAFTILIITIENGHQH